MHGWNALIWMGRVAEGLRNTVMFCGAGICPVDFLVIHVLNRCAVCVSPLWITVLSVWGIDETIVITVQVHCDSLLTLNVLKLDIS